MIIIIARQVSRLFLLSIQRGIVSANATPNTPLFASVLISTETKKTACSTLNASRPILMFGALSETRTRTACATAPSRQRVYQFHHQSGLSNCYAE
jgi:hypothetical protein